RRAEPAHLHRPLGELPAGRLTAKPGDQRVGKNHPNVDDYVISRVRALESLLLEKGLLAPDAVDRVIRRYETSTGPMLGARAGARAGRDPAYKQRLLGDSPAALGDFGVSYDRLVVVENTPARHNVVVCKLCSCYPWGGVGLPAA